MPEPTETPPTTAVQRLRRAFSGLPHRGQYAVAALLAALGFAAATQVRLIHRDEDFSGQRRENLIELLDVLSAAADRAQSQIDELETTRDSLESSSDRRTTALEEGRERLGVLGILAGTLPAVGPGVTVTITDPDGTVSAPTILDGIEELRDAGAEAIEINDQVRVVASTAFTEHDGAIFADDVELRPPYLIDAIGDSHTLREGVEFRGGLTDEVETDGGSMAVKERDVVEIGSLHTVKPPQYAQPTDG